MKRVAIARKTPMSRTGLLGLQSHARVAKAEPKPARGPRHRKCANKDCRAPFLPPAPFITWCGPDCGAVVALDLVAKRKTKIAKAERAETKRKLAEFKPLSYWLGIAERHCNAYIRARDPDICISCGVMHSSAWQAGHYKSVGALGTLRFHEDNIHKQCIKCNMELGGNAIQYRLGLLAKIGVERIDWLESWHPTVKMTAEYAQEVAETYKKKLKALRGG